VSSQKFYPIKLSGIQYFGRSSCCKCSRCSSVNTKTVLGLSSSCIHGDPSPHFQTGFRPEFMLTNVGAGMTCNTKTALYGAVLCERIFENNMIKNLPAPLVITTSGTGFRITVFGELRKP
jgi:hypothetical protein